MEFRESKIEDIDAIMKLIKDAKEYLKYENIDQWNNGYPNKEIIALDIENGNSYVLVEEGKIVGTLAAIFGIDKTYNKIYEGEWLVEENNYVVIHRIAISNDYKGQGLASKMFEDIEKIAIKNKISSMRIDTHKKNNAMLNLIEKNGFRYCGIIYVNDGGERVAYEKVLNI